MRGKYFIFFSMFKGVKITRFPSWMGSEKRSVGNKTLIKTSNKWMEAVPIRQMNYLDGRVCATRRATSGLTSRIKLGKTSEKNGVVFG